MDWSMPGFPVLYHLPEFAQIHVHQRRQWQPTPVLLPGKSHGQRSLVGCSPWGRYVSDTTEWLHFHALEKEMASHSSVLAWRIPGMGEPDGLPSMGLHSRTWLKRLSSSSMSIESVMPSNHLILCHPLLLLPSILPSIRVFSSELALYVRWPKYWSFSFSISPSNKYLGLISFRIDSLDLLAVQGMFQSLLQHHSSKASILQHSAFFTVQL